MTFFNSLPYSAQLFVIGILFGWIGTGLWYVGIKDKRAKQDLYKVGLKGMFAPKKYLKPNYVYPYVICTILAYVFVIPAVVMMAFQLKL